MQVTIHYLAQIKRAAGVGMETVELPAGATLRDLLEDLCARHGDGFRAIKTLLFFVNDEHAALDRVLDNGAEVAILAPMAGG